MAATFVQKCVLCAGFISLFHAAFSAAQHRTHLRITEQEFDSLPLDILVQGIVSLFVTMYGVMCIAGDFKEIRATVDLESRSWGTLRNIPSFYIFSHRGKAFSPEYSSLLSEMNNYPNQKVALDEVDI